ncbi:hypothetical protein [Nostoc sp. UHCC 0251]|uniref:hypothetical protein n=1 Tax=Nostoc sp. UHCC 0251 TaxID=3110240 RepID=UPI002B1F61F8|nr:hypothetical protein [Nostoc sp. UHCC 0251]MEA5623643.1 hypothetical protein [Nostoc sp. UHCC 0251]
MRVESKRWGAGEQGKINNSLTALLNSPHLRLKGNIMHLVNVEQSLFFVVRSSGDRLFDC